LCVRLQDLSQGREMQILHPSCACFLLLVVSRSFPKTTTHLFSILERFAVVMQASLFVCAFLVLCVFNACRSEVCSAKVCSATFVACVCCCEHKPASLTSAALRLLYSTWLLGSSSIAAEKCCIASSNFPAEKAAFPLACAWLCGWVGVSRWSVVWRVPGSGGGSEDAPARLDCCAGMCVHQPAYTAYTKCICGSAKIATATPLETVCIASWTAAKAAATTLVRAPIRCSSFTHCALLPSRVRSPQQLTNTHLELVSHSRSPVLAVLLWSCQKKVPDHKGWPRIGCV